ncbi:MAG: winged helix-turn-helix transcriptional regulator [Pseudomonadales bacterium]|nr:winged helix-turn-helix transcriptional regulator [Pseudomonadales bacterium]
MARPTDLQLAWFLPYRLSVLSNTISSAMASDYSRRFKLSIPEWRVLAVLADTPNITAADISARTAMDKVAVSRAVADLLAREAIVRAPVAADRRKSHLCLSASGMRMYAEVVPVARRYEQELLNGLTPTDRAALDRIVHVLLERAAVLGPAEGDNPR